MLAKGMMSDKEKLQELLNELRKKGQLPALDGNIGAICTLTADPRTCTSDLTAVILRDCSLTSNVIATANSALYRPAEPIKTVSAAIVAIGFEKVRSLAVGLGIVKQVSESARNRNLYRLFAGAYFTGMFAMSFGRSIKMENPEELFVMGVLSGLPRLLLANAFPERYAEMEDKVTSGKDELNGACREAFGVNYRDLAAEIAEFWKIPASVVHLLKGEDGASPTVSLLSEANHISDMIFGSAAGGAEAMKTVENRLRVLVHNKDFKLPEFIGATCAADQNTARFFKLTPKDVEMMVRIVEWGKVSPAEVAKILTFGAANKELQETAREDPALVIGQILTDLTTCVRGGADINRVMLTAMEGIYRCVRPACVLVVFPNNISGYLEGRLFLGTGVAISASDFRVPLRQDGSVVARCLSSGKAVPASMASDLPQPLLKRLNLDFLLLVPIVAVGSGIGFYLVGRESAVPFSKQEEGWIEAIVEHVAMAFERISLRKPSAVT